MNSEPKSFASLSSGLLARKGAARPAMKPQGFGQIGATLEDLGWNDMGFEAPKPSVVEVRDAEHDAFGDALSETPLRNPLAALTPVQSPVHDQQAEIADRFSDYDQDAGDDEDIDETAELYEPEDEAETPVTLEPITFATKPVKADPLGLGPIHPAPVAKTEPIAKPEPAVKPELVVAPKPVAQPEPLVQPEPVSQVVRLPQPVAVPRPSAPAPRAAPGARAKAAFTLRLDPARHLKLRLACAVNARSAQQLVTAALDELLASMPELDEMAGRAPDVSQRATRKG